MRLALLTAALCLAPIAANATQESPPAPTKALLTIETFSPDRAAGTVPSAPGKDESRPALDTTPAEAAPQAAKPAYNPDAAPQYSHAEVCEKLVTAARARDLPVAFFARLIWQESKFKHDAVSPVGAIGIAQFMPATARGMDLENPFDAMQALPASAELLDTLKRRFGNIGLAAAAYNSTPKRIADWLRNKAKLPDETKRYVLTITGRPAESWRGARAHGVLPELPRYVPCTRIDNFVQVERSERRELQRAQAERLVAERAESDRRRAEAGRIRVAARAHKTVLAKAKPATKVQVAVVVPTRTLALAVKTPAPQRPLVAHAKSTRVAQAKPAPKAAKPIKLAGKIKVASSK